MPPFASTLFFLLAAAGCILLTAAQNLDHCGTDQIPSYLPHFRSDVKTTVGLLVKNQKPGPRIFFSHSPNGAVNSAAGAAICYTTEETDCTACLKKSAAKLAECNTIVGSFTTVACNMQFWRTFD